MNVQTISIGRFAAIVSGALLMAACATTPVPTSEASFVPSDRILEPKLLQPSSGTGLVTVKRDSGFAGSACSARIFVNGNPVADIRPIEKVVLHLAEGEHILSAQPNGLCGGGMSEVKATVKAGSNSSFRVSYGSAGEFLISPTAF